jgi:hypothetical protein
MCNATQGGCDCYGGPIPAQWARGLRRGYHASASWADELAGGVLAKLAKLGLTNSTVVAYVSDHGWKLGEHASWEKQTLWQTDLQTPFILSAPGLGLPGGRAVAAPVEHIDLAPTLAELCAVPVPAGWEGASLVPLLGRSGDGGSIGSSSSSSSSSSRAATKNATFAQVTRSKGSATMPPAGQGGWPRNGEAMGCSVTTADADGAPRWKYTEWPLWTIDGASGCASRDWGVLAGAELYDLVGDAIENRSKANFSSSAAVVAQLRAQLHAQFATTLPCPPAPVPPALMPAPAPAACAAQAQEDCGQTAKEGYDACHKCMFQHESDLEQHGCDWSQHAKFIHALCGPGPGAVAPPGLI